jgi:hypothetical protein
MQLVAVPGCIFQQAKGMVEGGAPDLRDAIVAVKYQNLQPAAQPARRSLAMMSER